MTREIPGFYYDEEKQKYFRIQRNHVLPTSSNVHTAQIVKAKQEQKSNQQRDRRRRIRKHIEHIQRSPVARGIGFKLLQRRIGARTDSITELISHEFASKLTSSPACGTSLSPGSAPCELVGNGFHVTREGLLTAAISIDDNEMPGLVAVWPSSAYASNSPYAYTMAGPALMKDQRSPFTFPRSDCLSGFDAPYENMSCFETSNSVIQVNIDPISASCPLPDEGPPWDIASGPGTSDLAICSGYHLYLAHLPSTAADLENFRDRQRGTPLHPDITRVRMNESLPGLAWRRSQMNVTFKDTNIIMTGERSGLVNFSDRRSGTGISRLQHSSSVLGTLPTKHTDQIIVHGFSTTSIYDLRYTKAPTKSDLLRCHRANPTTSFQPPPSTPVLDFAVPSDRQSERHSRGKKLAYSADLNLVAALSTKHDFLENNTQSAVTFYSASTGRKLPDCALTRFSFSHNVTCIDIKRIRDGMESILTLSGGSLFEWTLHGVLEADDAETGWNLNKNRMNDAARMSDAGAIAYSISRRWEDGNLGPV